MSNENKQNLFHALYILFCIIACIMGMYLFGEILLSDWIGALIPFLALIISIIFIFFFKNKVEDFETKISDEFRQKRKNELDEFEKAEALGVDEDFIKETNKNRPIILNESKSLEQNNGICPSCGSVVRGEYCEHCGRKHTNYEKRLIFKFYGFGTKEYRFLNNKLVDIIIKSN